MAGIEEVARRAGVSTATVSRALSGRGYVSDATRLKVQDAAGELGYVVSSTASGLASGRTRNVGVVVPMLSHWYFSSVVEGAERALLRHGYDTTLYNLGGDAAERSSVFTHFLLRKRVDAVIAINLELTTAEVTALHDLDKPLVGIGGPLPGVPTLALDDVELARLATAHLVSLGHTRIAHIGGGQEFDVDFHLPSNRRHGYEQALEHAGLAVDATLVRSADFTLQGGYRAAKQLLGSPADRPTAIFAASDDMAIGAILAARDLGLSVPHDVSIVGVDDTQQAPFFDLTTIAQFPRRQGEAAVDVLLAELGELTPEEPTDFGLPFELVVRGTTTRPPRD
ncbi:DNA-binding transcriptional regulator, LacI/PurR family [Paramicrobacterium humi]|uniref:DNA-binding transcriptional regulator, LacI/PurR family n=1 Tax=Paramicrobacterium humi TaxID=640635 RepID=A0A1H4JDR6_9MICO|nr:LacI family DNA-binding transcriptional regulator [Microbacterium humi]SEB43768.1 DNA-binding transcriptional regulator, LacI/PurR family [Microbacterium humi]